MRDLIRLVSGGRQRLAVAKALAIPGAPALITERALVYAPRIRIHEVSTILKLFMQKGLVCCLNPKDVNGRIYCWSEKGGQVVEGLGLGHSGVSLTKAQAVHLGFISKGQSRRKVVQAIGVNGLLTSREIWRYCKAEGALSRNSIIRATRALLARGVVEVKIKSEEGWARYGLSTTSKQLWPCLASAHPSSLTTNRSPFGLSLLVVVGLIMVMRPYT